MKRLVLAAVASLLVGGALIGAAALSAAIPATPLEAALAARGIGPLRVASDTWAAPHLLETDPPEVLVLARVRPLAEREAADVLAFVEAGGVALLVLADPRVPGAEGLEARALVGVVHAEDGGAALARREGIEWRVSAARALVVEGARLRGVVETDVASFRDVDGDARLDAGEPGGEMTLVAEARVGKGRLLLAASDSPSVLAPSLALLLPQDGRALVHESALATPVTSAPLALVAALTLPMRSPLALVALVSCLGALVLANAPRREPPAAGAQRLREIVEAYRSRSTSLRGRTP